MTTPNQRSFTTTDSAASSQREVLIGSHSIVKPITPARCTACRITRSAPYVILVPPISSCR